MKQPYSKNNPWHVCFRVMLCICGVLGVCTSCSKDENEPSDATPLSFTFSAIDESRAASDVYEEYTGSEFGVYAKLYRPEYTAGTQGELFMPNEKVTYNGTSCDTEKNYYWVKGDTHFAAYSPYTSTPESEAVKVTLPQTPYAGYRFEGTVDGHTDYMFSDEQVGGYEDFPPNGSVPIIFHHALTKVEFFVKLSKVQEGTTTWSFDVNSLQLVNLRNQGNIGFTHQAGADVNTWECNNTHDVWNYDDSKRCDMAVANNVSGMADKNEHQIGETLYLMPQLLHNKGENEYVQSLDLQYTQHTTKGGTTKTVTNTVTVPLRTSHIAKWGINSYVKYVLLLEPGGSVELVAEVQPWELNEFTNEFDNTVTVNSDGKIVWTEGSYERIDNEKVVLHDDISIPAEFTFNIAGPLGGTWKAFFITKTGNNDAFILSQSEGPVGTPCTVTISAQAVNTSNIANTAELCFAVLQGSNILPVDALTNISDGSNYTIVQNINK